ncbi:hypothetical protein [Ramlibacter rhizophilus]|uniref:Uncharacterized protein n=1 Tax=Ramlibacter rhizophilus TaxID=1781167 RepID=A0A4Z0BF40_9BURK|nr:hypothetical protein [Ramlibacter rhizophilus]TFY96734.1 hypothetical protein EZ242_18770 [Ramlibacter rhizophilus]
MSLLDRLFRRKLGAAAAPPSQLDEPAQEPVSSRSVPRREVVHVVLRETMRQHAIPMDWIECRTLGVVQSGQSSGTYVTLIVKGGQERLLAYVPAFQASFRQALLRFDPLASEWLRGLAWQFDFDPAAPGPQPASEAEPTRSGDAPADADEELASDLQALYAIRDAALRPTPRE